MFLQLYCCMYLIAATRAEGGLVCQKQITFRLMQTKLHAQNFLLFQNFNFLEIFTIAKYYRNYFAIQFEPAN